MSNEMLPDIEALTTRVRLLEKIALLEKRVSRGKKRKLFPQEPSVDQYFRVPLDIVELLEDTSPKERGLVLSKAIIEQAVHLSAAAGAYHGATSTVMRFVLPSVEDREALVALAKREKLSIAACGSRLLLLQLKRSEE